MTSVDYERPIGLVKHISGYVCVGHGDVTLVTLHGPWLIRLGRLSFALLLHCIEVSNFPLASFCDDVSAFRLAANRGLNPLNLNKCKQPLLLTVTSGVMPLLRKVNPFSIILLKSKKNANLVCQHKPKKLIHMTKE